MITPPHKTRFAPSPTGYMHLGNVRTALFNALSARRAAGVFLLRIEDTDSARSRPEFEAALKDDLRWLGLNWQEGPGVGGGQAPYVQSQRAAIYRHYYSMLVERGCSYPCFCSPKELELSRRAQRAAGRPPRYAGTCARLSAADIEQRRQRGLLPTWRFRVPAGETVRYTDLVRGEQAFATDDMGDFIIRRADGTPAFFFSNAVDDALMGVTHVLRGEDHLANTPRQLLLLQALDLTPPRYGHITLITGPDGAPLSKRHGSRSVRELREAGYLPGAVTNYLARLGHYYESNAYMGLDGLAAGFDFARLSRSPARYDPAQLNYWQREAVVHADTAALWNWLGETLRERVPPGQRDALLEAIRPNITLPADAAHWVNQIYADNMAYSDAARAAVIHAGEAFFRAALAAVTGQPGDFKTLAGAVQAATGARGKHLFKPLRAALTGEVDGPELGKILPLIGAARIRSRLEHCVRMCAG
ncbi:MAG TPA: glutamate--tRNA ligase [Gammaproteobacteria bacterium]|nr:glutamate--tRNA ligase [Gammaproteobacteria bacterium]